MIRAEYNLQAPVGKVVRSASYPYCRTHYHLCNFISGARNLVPIQRYYRHHKLTTFPSQHHNPPPQLSHISNSMAPTLSFLLSPLLILPLLIAPSASSIGDENWTTAVRKGSILYEQLQSGCFPEDVNPVTLADLQAG